MLCVPELEPLVELGVVVSLLGVVVDVPLVVPVADPVALPLAEPLAVPLVVPVALVVSVDDGVVVSVAPLRVVSRLHPAKPSVSAARADTSVSFN